MLCLLFITGTFTTSFNPISASSELVENSWYTKKPMSQARSGLGLLLLIVKFMQLEVTQLMELYRGYFYFTFQKEASIAGRKNMNGEVSI